MSRLAAKTKINAAVKRMFAQLKVEKEYVTVRREDLDILLTTVAYKKLGDVRLLSATGQEIN